MAGPDAVQAPEPAVRLRGIWKTYSGGVQANRGIDLAVRAGSIHGLLGENGAGKSTLMKVLFGLVSPTRGGIELSGRKVRFGSPADALEARVGMVQQHFSLIPDFTVTQNLILGNEPTTRFGRLALRAAAARIQELSDRYGFRIDPNARVADMSVGARQRVEILKILHRGAEVLILDEPTAALTPQESAELHGVLRTLREQGRTVIFISHKLAEVIDLCDRVTVLRDGEVVGEREIGPEHRGPGPDRDAVERDLARMMVGRDLPAGPGRPHAPGAPVLILSGATDGGALAPIDMEVRGGEIVGLAGVEGNGQNELIELILGIRGCASGRILLNGTDVTRWPVDRRLRAGIGHIAEDRQSAALVMSMPVAENALLGYQNQPRFHRRGRWLSVQRIRDFAAELVRRFDVRTPSVRVTASSLSGGNQQKLVVGRELARRPSLIVAAQPTRGLDLAATSFVHEELDELRADGRGVLLVSLDLTEIMTLSDRILVVSGGAMVGSARPSEVDEETLGLWMTRGRTDRTGSVEAAAT
ncbi:MAG: ABC transporter ATP-binding protein [Actinobacteria bacterium]|nr:ABC transporter ATP-binding protein [Actinomycetota bacterium]